jgi:predicted DNA repair protein MutK
VLPYLLILGGSYLCFEGAEKVLEWFGVQHGHADESARDERKLVLGAVRTDLILSTEIMLISLASLDKGLDIWSTLAILAVIAVLMTIAVYGAVALLVKIDDIGLKMAKNPVQRVRHTGTRIVRSMPAVFRFISVLGTVAMLWVGGHLVLINLGEVGLHAPADMLHAVEHALEPFGGFVVWVVDTIISAIAGLAWGLVIVGIVLGIAKLFGKKPSFHEGETSPADIHV